MTADPRANRAFDAIRDTNRDTGGNPSRLEAEQEQRRRDEALAQAQARLDAALGSQSNQTGYATPPAEEPPTVSLDPVDPQPITPQLGAEAPIQASAQAPMQAPQRGFDPLAAQPTPPTTVQPVTPGFSPPPVAAVPNNPGVRPAPPPPQHSVGDESLDFLGGERNVQDFLRANRHSGRVRVLRIALPLIGLFILSVVIGAYFWSQSGAPSVTVQSASMDDGRMVMSNPKIDGVDNRQRPYTLIAREAIQDPAELGKVELTEIDAKVPVDEGIFAKILAGKGFYDSDAKTLKLDQSVDIKTDDGVTMTLQDADVDMEAGNLVTGNPVSIKTEQAEVSADSFTVENNGEKVVFQDRVRMTIFPGKFDRAERDSISQLLQPEKQN